jgi:lysophospholipase L1-like esterase
MDRSGVRWLQVLVCAVLLALPAVAIGLAAGRERPLDQAAAAPEEQDQVSVSFVGDSWTEGYGATALRGYAVLLSEQSGWRYEVLGVGGSGYDLPGLGAPFADRMDEALAGDPDVVVVQGSLNERESTLGSLGPAAAATLGRLRAEAGPATDILVLGAPETPGTVPAVTAGINGTIAAAAADLGLRFIDPVAENWTDPADPTVWMDPFHPNDRGHQLVADGLKPILGAMVAERAGSAQR